MAAKVIGTRSEPTAVIFLNSYIVKLTLKYLHLNLLTNAVLGLCQRSF